MKPEHHNNCSLRRAEKNLSALQDIENIVAKIARIPAKNISSSDKDVMKNLERNLKMVVFGQDQAITTLGSAIKMARSGLGEIQQPVGSFLFAGPTGVAKPKLPDSLQGSWGSS